MTREGLGGIDRVVNAVKQLNAGYNNTEYSRRQGIKFGSGTIYPVAFKGERGEWYENYVFKKGDTYKAYFSTLDLVKDSGNGVVPRFLDAEIIRLFVVSLLTFLFAVPVICIVVWQPSNPSLQVLTGLLGLTIGYFVGKVDKTS